MGILYIRPPGPRLARIYKNAALQEALQARAEGKRLHGATKRKRKKR